MRRVLLSVIRPVCRCGEPSALTDGSEIYPHLANLHEKAFWVCRPCGAYVGCHPRTRVPLGTLAGPELRVRRMEAHKAVDRLWRGQPERKRARGLVYTWLALRLGLTERTAHVGSSDEEQCVRITELTKAATFRTIEKELEAWRMTQPKPPTAPTKRSSGPSSRR